MMFMWFVVPYAMRLWAGPLSLVSSRMSADPFDFARLRRLRILFLCILTETLCSVG